MLQTYALNPSATLGDGQVLTTESGTFAGIDIAAEPPRASKLQLRDDGIRNIMNVPLRQEGRKRTELFFPDSRVLVSVRPADDDRPRILVIDTETGAELDVTPSNLAAVWDGNGNLPLVAWTGSHGLSLYRPGQGSSEFVIWQGHNTLAEVQDLQAVAGYGYRFSDDGLQFVVANRVNELLGFTGASGLLEVDPEGSGLAGSINSATDSGQRPSAPVRMALAADIAVFRSGGSHWCIVDGSGSQDYIEIAGDGLRNEPQEALSVRNEAASQPDWIINDGHVLPVDRLNVGIFDQAFQRLVLIGPLSAD